MALNSTGSASVSSPVPSPLPSSTASLRERLAHLPRDTRDTLFQMAVIGWTVAPHLLHLPPWCAAMTLALLAWRTRLALIRPRCTTTTCRATPCTNTSECNRPRCSNR